jgi:RNA polymerase sigma factor (sigma-70 family)
MLFQRNRPQVPGVLDGKEPPSDETLMQAYVQGDARAFDGLFARLAPSVHGFFLRSFGNRAVADDLLQLTFLKLHRSRADYNPELPVKPWLFTIASRVRLDELRRRYRVADTTSEEDLDTLADARATTAATAEQELLRNDEQKAVQAALACLPESQRVVIQLHRFEGLKLAEIAEILGTTETAVKLRAFRGYEQLRLSLRHLVEESK